MKRFISIIVAMLCLTLAFAFAACSKGDADLTPPPSDTGGGQTEQPDQPEQPEPPEQSEEEIPENSILLTTANAYNSATAYFSASYTDSGIVLSAYVKDDDVKADIFYSSGYDDNVEYLIGTQYGSAAGWEAGRTLHFLITADGDTIFQKAVSSNGWGESYALDLLCVNGVNFSYSSERTSYGYKTEVYIGYELLGTDAASGRNNIYVCPAMRNTHDYGDTVWSPFQEGGCEWSNASSFLRVDENEGYVLQNGG